MKNTNKRRKDNELPECIDKWGWKYHHTGIPTKNRMPDETYLPALKFYVSGFPVSPFGIEWMRFEIDSPVHPLIQKVPHVAFEVDDLELELSRGNFIILSEPEYSAEGIKVAMIEHNGAPIELIQFD